MIVFAFIWRWWDKLTVQVKEKKMTAPTPPSKAKTYVGLLGSLLAVGVPIVLELSAHLPPQYQLGVGGVIALLTAFGIYHAPYNKT